MSLMVCSRVHDRLHVYFDSLLCITLIDVGSRKRLKPNLCKGVIAELGSADVCDHVPEEVPIVTRCLVRIHLCTPQSVER